eukprot:211895_1
MKSPEDIDIEQNVTLCLFVIKTKSLLVKSAIMLNRSLWEEQNFKMPPYNQVYWNTVILSKYFLNLLYQSIILCWQNKLNNVKVMVRPVTLRAQYTTYWINNPDIHNSRLWRFYVGIRTCTKGQCSVNPTKYAGVTSIDNVFNNHDICKLMNILSSQAIFHFVISNKSTEINKESFNMTEFIDKIAANRLKMIDENQVNMNVQEKQIQFAQHNCQIVCNYIKGNAA